MKTTLLINDKRLAEQAAQESEQRYKRLLASVTDYVYTVTVEQGRPTATSHGPGCEAVTGYTSSEFDADPFLWYRMIHIQDRPAVTAQAERILQGETPPPLEHRIVHKDGRIRWIRNTPVPHKDRSGRLITYDGLVSDVTERKHAEEEHRLAEAQLQAILDNSPAVIHLKDTRGRYILTNRRFQLLFHVSREDAIGKSQHDLFPLETASTLRNHDQQVLATLTPMEFEETLPLDGQPHTYLSVKFPLLDASGAPYAVCGISTDITERKHAELALRRSYQTQEVLNSLLSFSLQDISLEETLLQVIDQLLAVQWLSLQAKGAIFVVDANSSVLVLKAHRNLPASLQARCALVPFGACLCGQAAASGEIAFGEHIDERHKISYEGMPPHGHYCVPILSAGKVLGVINLYLNDNHRPEPKEKEFLSAVSNVVGGIVRRKQAEEKLKQALAALTTAHEELKATHEKLKGTELELIQAAKLESLGTLAAGVAHEVKNPLQTILMGLDYLDNNLPGGNDNTGLVLRDMRGAVSRANVIVREMVQLSSATDFEPKAEDLNGLVESSLLLVNNQVIAAQVSLVRSLAPDLPWVPLDRNKMEQVLINLFINALQAMSSGGILKVTTRHSRLGGDLKPGALAFPPFQPSESVVILEVQDTGTGIPEDLLPRIFDPFFTTKPTGVGTGLGLSVVKKIIDLHGGAIDIRNAPAGGAMVTLLLRALPGVLP